MAALVVVAHHFMLAFKPQVEPTFSSNPPAWVDSPLGILINGSFSVSVFFVLSGFVLALTSQKLRQNLPRDLVARYLRLALPATASVIVAWMVLRAFPHAAEALALQTGSPWLDYSLKGDEPTFLGALKDGLYGIFTKGESRYNNVLWTMRIELFSSFGIYLFFQFVRRRQMLVGLLLTVALMALHANRGYVAFALGALLHLAWQSGRLISPRVAILIFAIGVALGAQANGFAGRHGLEAWPRAWMPGHSRSLWYPIAALFIVAGVLFSPGLRRFFELPICRFLGRISFPIYLLHVPLIYTLVAWFAVRFGMVQGAGLLPLFCGFLLFAIAAAWLFERYVDQPALGLKGRLPKNMPKAWG